MTAQDFVDSLNFQSMPQMGYKLRRTSDGLFWQWPGPETKEMYPANEAARAAIRKGKNGNDS